MVQKVGAQKTKDKGHQKLGGCPFAFQGSNTSKVVRGELVAMARSAIKNRQKLCLILHKDVTHLPCPSGPSPAPPLPDDPVLAVRRM